MAIFVRATKHGIDFIPPPATGTMFGDVPANAFGAAAIEQLAREGTSTLLDRQNGGCGTGYCPNAVVTRAQMSPMLLRAKYGRKYQPPAATGIFSDVAPGTYFAPWIEEMYREGITAGCGTNPLRYCPDSAVTRGQMAVFLVASLKVDNFPPAGYASSITYHPNGLVNQVVHANGITDTQSINSATMMARPSSIGFSGTGGAWPTWSSGTYGYDGASNITAMGLDYANYDLVSRVKEASADQASGNQRKQSYTFDRFGNLTGVTTYTNGSPSTRTLTTSTSTNRLSSASYDAAGRLLTYSPEQFTYDELSATTSYRDGLKDLVHLYTADDERIWTYDMGSSASTFRIRDFAGNVLRDYARDGAGSWSFQKDTIYRSGQLLAIALAHEVEHFHLDHLGSPRMVTAGNGARRSFHSYYAFGEEAGTVTEDSEVRKFTGQERDLTGGIYSDSSLNIDYFHARYDSGVLGRFLSVDPVIDVKKAINQPQMWNRYAYVVNNPMRFTDPTGREHVQEWGFTQPLSEADWRDAPPIIKGAFYAESGLLAAGALNAAVDIGVGLYEGFQTWRAVRAGQVIASTATGAYEAAEKGGRHSGYLANMAGRPINEIANAINGYGKVIQQHLQWLANPTLKVADWAGKTSAEQEIIRQKWLDDIARNKQLQDLMQGLFERLMR